MEAEPFSVEHFRGWASRLILDSGEPWQLEPFQESFVADVFAGFRECWLIVPEGNGKSTLVAGLVLYHAEFTADAWVPLAASSRDQARIMYRQAKGFVARSPELAHFKCFDGYRRIDFRERGSQIEVFAADERTGDGIIPTWCVLDELHRHRSLDLYETWRGKLDKRNAQIVVISTAGEPGTEFEEARERIRQQATEAERDETFTRAVYENQLVLHEWAVPESGDVEDLELVKRANPFSGVTTELLRRKRESPTMTVGHWRRFTCNLPTRSEFAAITEQEWYDAGVDEDIPVGEPIDCGLDLGWQWDTTALVPLWWKDAEHRLLGQAVVLVPPRDGSMLDHHLVEAAFIALNKRNPIRRVVMDITRGEQMATWLSAEIGCEVVERPQGLVAQVDEYERFMEALRHHWLRWAKPNQALTQHALNAIARILPKGDAVFARPVEGSRMARGQDRRVIDALKAASMVHATIASDKVGSVYDDREVLVV